MEGSMRRLILAAVAAAPLLLAFAPAMALGSCMMPAPIEEAVKTADIVFVGTVTETANRSSWASVEVTEVWRGPDQPRAVVVKGGPEGNAATSVDRTFEAGVTYLFFPYAETGVGLADNSCTSTTPWTEDLDALRPANSRAPIGAEPEAGGFDLAGVLVPFGIAVIVGAALLLAGLAARGRSSD
jgi:hypothetical protein